MPQVHLSAQSSNTRLLNHFYGIFFLVCNVFLTIGVPFVFSRKTVSALVALTMMLAVWLAWRMSCRGQPQKSLLFFAAGLWLVLVALIYAGLPPYSAATALAMAVMLAVVVHLHAGVIFGASYLLAWLLYIVLHSAQLAPAPYFIGNAFSGWFIGAIAFWLVLLPIPQLVRSLRHGKEQFEAILNATPEGIFLLDRDGVLLALNATGAHRMNTDPQQLLGQCVFDAFPPDVAATRRASLAEVFRTGHSHSRQHRPAGRSERGFCAHAGLYARRTDARQCGAVGSELEQEQLHGKIVEMIQHGGAFETVHRRKDGSLLEVEVHASDVCIEGQSYLYAASRDISQRKRNEARARPV